MGPATNGNQGTRDWISEANGAVLHPRSAVEVLAGLSEKVNTGVVTEYQPIPLGFSPLDRTLGGGIRSGELMLIGGAQGTGKTTMSLQIARNMAQSGQANVLYVCFEHDEEYLLSRLMAMESALAGAMPPSPNTAVKIQDVRREVLGTWLATGGQGVDATTADLRANPRLAPSLERIARYGQSLFLLRGSHAATTAAEPPFARRGTIGARRLTGRWSSSSTISSACRSTPSLRQSPRRSPTLSPGSRTLHFRWEWPRLRSSPPTRKA